MESSMVLIIVAVCLAVLTVMIFFFLTQQNVLKLIQPHNRLMSPGEVWLQLIPIFGTIWAFFVVSRISDSIRRELAEENTFSFENGGQNQLYLSEARPTYNVGMAYCILACITWIPVIGTITSIVAVILWIIYWSQLSSNKARLHQKKYMIGSHHPTTVDSPPSLP